MSKRKKKTPLNRPELAVDSKALTESEEAGSPQTETPAGELSPQPETAEELSPGLETAQPEGAEPVPEGEEPLKPASREPGTSKGMLAFGGIVLVFAVIGLISTIVFFSRLGVQVADNKWAKDKYERLITPLVLQDPPTFEGPYEIIDSTLITAGVWQLIMNEDTSKYPVDDLNFISVPESDIEVQIKALFGEVEYTHQSVGHTDLLIAYDRAEKTYTFPAVPHVLAYTPEVQEIQTEGKKIILTVGYIPPGPIWEGDVSGNKYQPAARKIMTYTLLKGEKGSLQIYSLTGMEGEGSDVDMD